jgi:hypothetical protein
MQTIYKSCSPKYTNKDIQLRSGSSTSSTVSFERLLVTGIKEAISLKPNEVIVGMEIDYDGVRVFTETKE